MRLKNWRERFQPQILRRGIEYSRDEQVEELQVKETIVRATVRGTDRYQVELEIEDGELTDWSCTCPYAENGDLCKHMAAVCCELVVGDYDFPAGGAAKRFQEPPQEEPKLEDLIDKLTLGEIRNLLLTAAERHRDIASAIRSIVSKPESASRPEWQETIDNILWEYADDDGFLDYGNAWDAISEVDEYVDLTAGQLLEQGDVKGAFELTGYAFQTVGDWEMDDSDGGLNFFGFNCYNLWAEQVEAASGALREIMYQWFDRVGQDHSLDLYREIAHMAQQELFHAPEELKKNLSRLDDAIKNAEEGDASWWLSELVLKKMKILEELGAPKEELDEVEETYWHLPQIRQRAVDRFLDSGETGRAIAILKEGKEQDDFHEHCSQQLIEIYRASDQTEELLEELNYQVFRCDQDDLENIKILKAQLPEEAWPEWFEKILDSKTTEGCRDDLLAWEGQYERLLDYVVKAENINILNKWERALGPRFPEEMLAAYADLLDAKMVFANGRGYYAHLISYFKLLKRYPGGKKKAQELANQWRKAYPRRTSMYDELKKAGY